MKLKRHPALIPLSHEHREMLSFCLQLRKGIQKKEEIKALRSLTLWFWESYVKEHFQKEETQLFPLLKNQNELFRSLNSQHDEIKAYFESEPDSYQSFQKLEQKLTAHIRFEERIVFQKLQEEIPDNALNQLSLTNQGPKLCFWKGNE
jgi:iron-sulfur cluster repair protein YtfE (RIC family)